VRIAVATDAWVPQPNGVVRVLGTVIERLRRRGYEFQIISPELFRTLPCPGYSEIPLSVLPGRKVARLFDEFRPDAIHIATEGPIGIAARAYCRRNKLAFTTAYHTKFPEYIAARSGLPARWIHVLMRRFHSAAANVMVPAPAVFRELTQLGYRNLRQWSHGVDTDVFKPGPKDYLDGLKLPRPLFMFIGRVTVEKNLPAFLDLDLPGSKVVIGSGPARESLMKRYPEITFRVADGDGELARYYNAADVFVFPSLTDTFGLVMLEALACGVPVAAFPVTGPLDVIGDSGSGVLDRDLRKAALGALDIRPELARARALALSWDRVVEEFLSYLAPIERMAAHERNPSPARSLLR
jgi:glycosyltransferase involved in cell wall biosynthesis